MSETPAYNDAVSSNVFPAHEVRQTLLQRKTLSVILDLITETTYIIFAPHGVQESLRICWQSAVSPVVLYKSDAITVLKQTLKSEHSDKHLSNQKFLGQKMLITSSKARD